MLKKAIPFVLVSGLVLGACGMNDGAVPKKNETPMENMEDREKDWMPNVRDEQRGGMDMDGLDNSQDMNSSNVKDGIINEDNTTHPNDDGIRENGMKKDGMNKDGMNKDEIEAVPRSNRDNR